MQRQRLRLLPELKGIFHPQLGLGGGGGGGSRSQQTLSLLTEHVNKYTYPHWTNQENNYTPISNVPAHCCEDDK